MKVLHITTTDIGGAGLCCIRIHKSLLDLGVESKVLVEFKTKSEEGVYSYGLFKEKICRIPSKLLRKIGLSLTERNEIARLAKKYGVAFTRPVSPVDICNHKLIKWADVIHLHFVNNYLDYPSFFEKIKKPVVWTLHDENLFYGISHYRKFVFKDHPLEMKYRFVKHSAISKANNLTIVFLSEMMYNNFGTEEIIAGRKKTVINNPVDTQFFYPLEKREVRAKYNLNTSAIYFAFISFNIADPMKGLDLLSDVLKILLPEAEILAIGGNPQHKKWPNVKEMGFFSDPRQICEVLNCANFFAMPSFQEAFSLSPLEAMSCGIPVVAFPVSGTSELINESNGVICKDFSKESLVLGIQDVLNRTYSTQLIRSHILNHFSLAAVSKKYFDLYNDLIH